MNLFFKIIILTIFLFLQEAGFADTSLKLLIPNESYKNEDQKQNEIINFGQSGLTAKEWRIKKCYRNVTFNIFWKSGLCPTDPHMCIHSYTVEELHFFKKYYDYLLQISELCADGYVLKKTDRDFFKKSTQGEVDRFIEKVRKNRKKKIDYSRPLQDQFANKNNIEPTQSTKVNNKNNFKQNQTNEQKKNKEELELLKKQVKDLKEVEKKKQKEIEKLRISEKKKLKELELARKAEKKRLKEIKDAKKIEEERERELILQKKLLAEEEKKIQQQKKLMETEKNIEEIKKMIDSDNRPKKSNLVQNHDVKKKILL